MIDKKKKKKDEDIARKSVRRKLHDQLRILQLLAEYPSGLICDEAEALLNMSHQTCSARFSDMKKLKWILPTGQKRLTRYGRDAGVFYSKLKVEEEE